jgi:hypothetical protein
LIGPNCLGAEGVIDAGVAVTEPEVVAANVGGIGAKAGQIDPSRNRFPDAFVAGGRMCRPAAGGLISIDKGLARLAGAPFRIPRYCRIGTYITRCLRFVIQSR